MCHILRNTEFLAAPLDIVQAGGGDDAEMSHNSSLRGWFNENIPKLGDSKWVTRCDARLQVIPFFLLINAF